MDISVIDATKVNTEIGLHIGESNACQNDRIYQCSLSLLQKMV